MKVYLIRHGETEANRKKVYAGVSSYGLNESGKIQATKLQNIFQKYIQSPVLLSPLLRCKETAEIIGFSQPVHFVEGFREISFGLWENLDFTEIESRYPEYVAQWAKDPWEFTFPQGECLKDYYQKVIHSFKKEVLTKPYVDKIIIAHKGTFSCILSYLLGGGQQFFWTFQFDCGSYSVIEINNSQTYIHTINRLP